MKLFAILEDTGASEIRRESGVESATNREIFGTLLMRQGGRNTSLYISGSKYEGTYTPGMRSDVDNLIISEVEPVILDLSDAPPKGISLLLIQDTHTPPGYAKLQVVLNGVALTGFEKSDFSSLDSDPFDGMYNQCKVFDAYVDKENRLVRAVNTNLILGGQRHGPAITGAAIGYQPSRDDVFAFRSCRWPACALEWFNRPRQYGYPPVGVIQKSKRVGFFVGIPTVRSNIYNGDCHLHSKREC